MPTSAMGEIIPMSVSIADQLNMGLLAMKEEINECRSSEA